MNYSTIPNNKEEFFFYSSENKNLPAVPAGRSSAFMSLFPRDKRLDLFHQIIAFVTVDLQRDRLGQIQGEDPQD